MQINPALTIEDFGDEVIIVNLKDGAYFSLKNSSADLWRLIQGADSLKALMDQIFGKYYMTERSLKGLRHFLKECRQDELLMFVDGDLHQLPTALEPSKNVPELENPTYEKFTNMQDILLLDPIHDAGELSWPHPK